MFLWSLTCCVTVGAAPTAQEVLSRVQAAYKDVKDYTAQVKLATDIPDLAIPDRTFKVYVKRPDKVKIESDRLIVVPKDALLVGNLEGHLAEAGRLVLVGVNRQEPRPRYCIKVFPEQAEERDRLLLWIEGERWTLAKSEIWAGPNRLLTVYWKHVKVGDKFWMPREVRCEVSGGVLGGSRPGTITITFTDYQVNRGLSDAIFAKER
jgi:hypothetical protein